MRRAKPSWAAAVSALAEDHDDEVDMLTDKELVRLIRRLDPATSALLHSNGVATITLIGWPDDVVKLNDYLMQKVREFDPGLPPRK